MFFGERRKEKDTENRRKVWQQWKEKKFSTSNFHFKIR
jgi:hypothetical protein